MSATFKQSEMSVREELNALNKYQNLTQEELETGSDIGGGETLYGNGAILGSNPNGEYTRYPEGVLVCTNSNSAIITDPYIFIGTPTSVDTDKLKRGFWK